MEMTVREAGRKGGQARAAALSPEKRREQAVKAAIARWEAYKRDKRRKVREAARRPREGQ